MKTTILLADRDLYSLTDDELQALNVDLTALTGLSVQIEGADFFLALPVWKWEPLSGFEPQPLGFDEQAYRCTNKPTPWPLHDDLKVSAVCKLAQMLKQCLPDPDALPMSEQLEELNKQHAKA